MSDDTDFNEPDDTDFSDLSGNRTLTDYTQVASCIHGNRPTERRRRTLRARLEREEYERKQQLHQSFLTTFRNLFGSIKH